MEIVNPVPPPKKQNNTFRKFYVLLRRILSMDADTDVQATIASITKSVQFRGANVWILAFAIIVASVGLNVNSTAVIIGAMLISPLMGPINGIGFSVGTNDSELLQKSLKNLLIMVVISLFASTTYFLLTPLSDAQSELLARTRPTIFDVLIAFFGGFAGIVAMSRKEQSITIISGVAIATALMPPLCTAGFGLATGQFKYFLGASYLFFINSFFIALATFIIVRYLNFPQKKYVDPKRSKFVRRGISIFAVLVIVPSIVIAVSVVREASFNTQAIKYVNEIQSSPLFEEVQFVNVSKSWDRKSPTITLSLVGRAISEQEIAFLKQELANFGLEKTHLVIKQAGMISDIGEQAELISDLLDRKDEQVAQQSATIDSLQQRVVALQSSGEISELLAREIAVQYPNVRSLSLGNAVHFTNGKTRLDTVPTLYITWQTPPTPIEEQTLRAWLKIRLELSELY